MPQNISKRQQAEEKLTRSELLLSDARQIAHIGSWNRDLQSGGFEWSDEHYRIFGLEPRCPRITPERAWGLVHPDDRERVKQIVARSIESRQPYERSLQVLHDEGTLVTCSLGGAAIARRLAQRRSIYARRQTGKNTRAVGGRSPHDPTRAGRSDQ